MDDASLTARAAIFATMPRRILILLALLLSLSAEAETLTGKVWTSPDFVDV
jgi:hypothetical protein